MKRVIAFLLLLALGITGLWLAIGTDDAVRASTEEALGQPARPRGSGVPLQQGQIGASVSQTGPIQFPQYRTIQVGDGTTRSEQVFFLKAADSKPLNETLQQLDQVEVLLFEADKATARLLARQAFVELSRDASGRPSLREHKDINLRDAVFETLPGAKMPDLRLDLGNARIQVGDAELLINTATEFDPVKLVVAGERSGTLHGRGMQARLPRDRSSAMQRVDVEILHDPVLKTAGVTVRATGRMHYVEDIATGAAQVSLDDDVHVDLSRGDLRGVTTKAGTGTGKAVTSELRGDQFTGWLQRKQRDEHNPESDEMVWRRLLLTGAPASVAIGKDRLLTPKITVLPGPLGDPFLVTAHGGESRIEINQLRPGSKHEDPIHGTSPRRIHMVSPGNAVGALHRQLGFPQWTLRPLNELQVLVFDGSAHLESGERTVDASKGLHVFLRNGSERGVAQGFGDTRITQRGNKPGEPDLVATGNDGFHALLTETTETWRLGPALPADLEDTSARWRSHRYEVQQGATRVSGTGACEVERSGDRIRLRLRAVGPQITGRLAVQGVDLADVHQLEALLQGKELVALDAAGLPARATRTRGGQVVSATAPRLLQIGPRSLRLLAAPAEDPRGLWARLPPQQAMPVLSRTMAAVGTKPAMQVRVEGPQIDVHHLGLDDVLVDAIQKGTARPAVNAMWDGKDGSRPTTLSLRATRLRALPFALTREVRQVHAGGATGPVADLPFHSLGQPWLLVDDVRDFRLDDPVSGLVQGQGRRLLLSQGAEAGLFVGDPDTLEPAEVSRTHEGRTVTTRGARVRTFRDEALRLQALRTFADRSTFLLPTVMLHDPRSTGPLAHMTASCQGNIDVLPDTVLFQGPVTAWSLATDGGEDPDGMHIDAKTLIMLRNAETGEIVRILGKDVHLEWSQVKARSAEVEVDLRWNRLIARDANGASIVMPDQRIYTAPRIELNYDTMAVRSFHGRLAQGLQPEVLQR